ncbi:uncharacterized protein K444DRAFT_527671 [Hyaloscypha bicolor E]|uniref:DUF1275 domain protein n=1 Tax=Hyaloscypha bicolor E TaxID=1095630 RepID=A0A2J6TD99_9HELO|nr:uncharacterized protein K444DRAFT_527671 [Hyaloscypha bicolor E]PMD60948.1 hypothetical protein K444DRAFT_527671 [Hyaloscypha bicolor E]
MVKNPPVKRQSEPALPTTEDRSPSRSLAKPRQTAWQSARSHLGNEISLSHADIPIIACCLVSGLCDSSAYNAWSCFVSMQTGNTIFLALGASGQPTSHPDGWLKSLLSIACFLCGCFCFASTRLINPKARGTLAASFLLQSICIIVAAALVQAHVVPEPKGLVTENNLGFDPYELLPLGFLAFQSGGQIVTSRLLGFNEVPTTVLTSVYCDLASDPKIIALDNVKRNRRAAAVLAILIGGIAGGWISRSQAGMSVSLWVAAAIKSGIAVSWSLWKPKTASLL